MTIVVELVQAYVIVCDISFLFDFSMESLLVWTKYLMLKTLDEYSPVHPRLIPCCKNSCMAFYGEHAKLTHCSQCNEPSKDSNKKPRSEMALFDVEGIIRGQFAQKDRAEQLHYREQHMNEDAGADIYNCENFKRIQELCGGSMQPQDVVYSLSTDGFQIFRSGAHDCWLVTMVNHNLPPTIRVKIENVIVVAMIPGPKCPADIGSFFIPIVESLRKFGRIALVSSMMIHPVANFVASI